MAEKFDFVIIGSGFGGGTAALRLSQAGKRVCVLERGRRWHGKNLPPAANEKPASAFPELGDSHFFWGRQLWRPTRQRLGLYEVKQMINLQGLVGAGVGGGSLIWANVVVKAPEWVFERNWPKEINRQTLDAYYHRADPYLRPKLIPGIANQQNIGDGAFNHRAEALKLAAAKVGRPWQPVPLAVNFGNQLNALPNGHGQARQLGCNLCGLCTAGCPQGAKNTVDKTYIAEAEALGAEIRPLHLATGIEQVAGGGYRVHFKRFNLDGTIAETGSVDAKRVVLSAGTFGSTELLLNCRKSGMLPNLSNALGKRFSINGNVLGGALADGKSSNAVNTNSGPAIASMIDYGRFAIEDIANPTWTAGIVGETNIKRMVAFSLALAGFKQTSKVSAQTVRDLLLYVGVGDDGARGTLKLNKLGLLSLDWPGGISREPGIQALHKAMAELAAAQGRRYVPNALSIFNRPVTYHPLGGCPMADTAENGVVDSYGRVFGYPGLFVADGSIVPTALGRNPSYTIAALAERIAEKMSQETD